MPSNSRHFLTWALPLLGVILYSCAQAPVPSSSGPVVLGSYFASITPDGSVSYTPISKQNSDASARNGPNISPTQAFLGWPESIGHNGPAPGYFPLRVSNCNGTNATYNIPALTLSVQFSIKNILSATTSECSSPDPGINYYCPTNLGNGLSAYLGRRILGPIQLKIWDYYGHTASNCADSFGRITGIYDTSVDPNTCAGNLSRSDLINVNHDHGCSDVSSGPCFYSDPGFDTSYTDLSIYKTLHPGFDMGTLLNTNDSDFDLDPEEVSGCKVMQFFYGTAGGQLGNSQPSHIPVIGFAFDVLGFIENEGAITDLPTVAPTSTFVSSTTLPLSATLNLSQGADRLRVTRGSIEQICIDNDVCDSDPALGSVTMNVTLAANQLNRLYIHQANADSMGPAVLRDVTHDATVPTVASITPPNGAINVSIGVNVFVSFSEAMDPSTISTSTLSVTAGGGNLCTSVSLSSDGLTATCSHTTNFSASTVHTVTVLGGGSGVKDVAGNALSTNATSTFTTSASDGIRPTVISLSPPDNAAGVPINIKPVIVFSEAMKDTTITDTNIRLWQGSQNACPPTSLSPVTSTVSLSLDQKNATLTPSVSLLASTQFTISVSTGVQDASGNTMLSAYCSTFTTSNTSDSTPPTVVGSTPNSAATDILNTIRPEIFFSEPMDASTLSVSTLSIKDKLTQVPVPISIYIEPDNLTVRMIPLTALSLNTTYVMTVLSEVKDIAGNSMGAPWAIDFSTSAVADTTAPTVILLEPADDSADNTVAPIIKLRFNEPMNASTIHTGTLSLVSIGDGPGCSAGAIAGSVSVSSDGLEATFNYPGVLCRRNTYTLTLTGGASGATDLAGNPLTSTYTASFLTSKRNNAGPTVVTASPSDSAVGVGTQSNAVITFDQVIDPTTVSPGTVYLSEGNCPSGGTAVTAALSISSDERTVTVDPSDTLLPNTTYRINVTTGVKDKTTPTESAQAFCSTFTTGPGEDTTGPTVTSTSPTDGTLNWQRQQSLSVTFSEAIDTKTVGAGNVELIRSSDSFRIVTAFSFNLSGTVLTINPPSILESDTTYYVNIKPSIRNTSGYALQSFTTFAFTTEDTSGDITPPTVTQVLGYKGTAYVSACGDTGMSRSTHFSASPPRPIKVYFSEPVDPDKVIAGVLSLLKISDNSLVQLYGVTIESQDADGPSPGLERSMATLTTEAQLSNNTNYRVRILSDVVDDAGNFLTEYFCDFGT